MITLYKLEDFHFTGDESIVSVKISSGITKIPQGAFKNWINLEN